MCGKNLLTCDQVSLDMLTAETCFGGCNVFFKFLDQAMQDLQVDFLFGGLAVYKDQFGLVVKLQGFKGVFK